MVRGAAAVACADSIASGAANANTKRRKRPRPLRPTEELFHANVLRPPTFRRGLEEHRMNARPSGEVASLNLLAGSHSFGCVRMARSRAALPVHIWIAGRSQRRAGDTRHRAPSSAGSASLHPQFVVDDCHRVHSPSCRCSCRDSRCRRCAARNRGVTSRATGAHLPGAGAVTRRLLSSPIWPPLTLPRPLARDQNRVLEIRLEGRAAIAGMTPHGELGMWQRRYWEHTIRDDQDFAADMDYTHFNPAKDGLVGHPADWLHSSFRPRVASGLYPAGWVGDSAEPQEAGERR